MGCSDFSSKATHRVTIQSPSVVTTSTGGRTSTLSDVGTYWAMIVPSSGRELFTSDSTQSRATHKITIRYNSLFKDIKTVSDYRISYDGRLFAVKAVHNLDTDMKNEGKEYQRFMVEENAQDLYG